MMARIVFEWFFGYALIWWIAWFVALPIGVEDEANAQKKRQPKNAENNAKDKNTDEIISKSTGLASGAPRKTFLWQKLVIVSALTAVLTTLAQAAIYLVF